MRRNFTRNFTRLVNILHPFRRAGGYALPHAVVLCLVFLAGATFGWFGRQVTYNGAYFRTHYQANLVAPANLHPHAASIPRVEPSSATIADPQLFPAVQNQGPIGQCATVASLESVDWSFRVANPRHPGIRFGPRALYSEYVSEYDNGVDGGSWPPQVAGIIASIGVPQWKQFPEPPYVIDTTIPPAIKADAAKHILPVTVQDYVVGESGPVIVDALHAVIAGGSPALLSVNVTPSWDNATETGGIIDYPGPETNRGGHEVVAIAYKPGFTEIQNSWSRAWGDQGKAWVSDQWLDANAWAVEKLVLRSS